MKNHHDYPIALLGGSDIAALIARGPGLLTEVKFGEDGGYKAYIVDIECEIPDHYKPVFGCDNWIKIYDDQTVTYEAHAKHITVYRAGMRGCIIRLED